MSSDACERERERVEKESCERGEVICTGFGQEGDFRYGSIFMTQGGK
jgi:hypothetical protein